MSTLMFIWMFILPSADLFSVSLTPLSPVWRVGDTQMLKCKVSDCPGGAHIILSRPSDQPLYAENLRYPNESVIYFAPVDSRHGYMIICKARCDGLSQTKQKQTTITVYSFPNDPVISGTANLIENETRNLSCNVHNVSAPDYVRIEWSLGDAVVTVTEAYTATSTASSAYMITPKVNDNGKRITCRATIFGQGIPEEFQTRETTEIFSVLYAPRDVKISNKTTVLIGESFTLTCEADGNPKPQVQWRKLGRSGPFLTEPAEKHVVDGATLSHAGEYECVVNNSIGRKTAKVAVIVQGSPRNTSIMVSPAGKLKEGDTVTIHCLSDGVPVGRVLLRRLSKDGMTELNSTSGSSTSITLSPAKLADSGQYECVASNQYGTHTSTVHVSVAAPPRNTTVEVLPSSQVHEGQNITICCKTVSFLPARVILKKLGSDWELYSTNGTFLLQNVMATDAGSYQVNVTNDLGYEMEVFTINVLEKHTRPSPGWQELFIPAIGVMSTLVTACLIIYYLRKFRMKNSYEMAKCTPGPV